jgi:proline racemase
VLHFHSIVKMSTVLDRIRESKGIYAVDAKYQTTVTCVDMHTCGEPLRVVTSQIEGLTGKTVLENRRLCMETPALECIRTALMREPRGHLDMYGAILLSPNPSATQEEESDFGVLFMHNEGYSTMCGHAIIALTTLAVDQGWIDGSGSGNVIKKEGQPDEVPVAIDAPCGRILAHAVLSDEGKVANVYFHCVPSFVAVLDAEVSIGEEENASALVFDIAFGGAFYAYVDVDRNSSVLGHVSLTQSNAVGLISLSKRILTHVRAQPELLGHLQHPETDMNFLYGVIFTSQSQTRVQGSHSRNVCVFADDQVDRSPTGSGVSGRMAIHHARKEVQVGHTQLQIESILDTTFVGSVAATLEFAGYAAVTPRVQGTAFVCGQSTLIIDSRDPLKDGFLIH